MNLIFRKTQNTIYLKVRNSDCEYSSSRSLQNIKDDISLISKITKTEEKGNELISDIDSAINTVKRKAT